VAGGSDEVAIYGYPSGGIDVADLLARLGLVEKGASAGDLGKVTLTEELKEKEASIQDVREAERRAGAAKIAALEAVVARVEGEAAGGDRLASEALRGAEAAARRASGDAQAEMDGMKRRLQVRFGKGTPQGHGTLAVGRPADQRDSQPPPRSLEFG